MFKLYRIIHIIWTAIFAFYVSIPILERGGLETEVYVDAIVIALWIIGLVLLFNKKLMKYGFILMVIPFVFSIILFIF